MKVYQIEKYAIAAENAEKAYMCWLDTNDVDFLCDMLTLEEGGVEELTITISRLTTEQINTVDIPCCNDGCLRCEGKDENVYLSYAELIKEHQAQGGSFPTVLTKDE
ncbi:hypothetical protein [Paenibacillus sp. EKM211P]|uniref:hypothetical protein n=1 Tax=Paenibacillus sp. EKM211P TaxID=1683679 RepID=UPI0013E979B8|nr:hypothetical protein [Paenibacillus sp. EKM211P]KAF6584974.1 hypothetical protein G9G57_07380 [Paenibacillus sp. EKM211P]